MPVTQVVDPRFLKQLNNFFEDALDNDKFFFNTEYSNTAVSCGINQMSELYDASIEEQLFAVLYSFSAGNGLFDASQIIFSDKVSSPYFKGAKEVSYQGPISVNPNTGNKIQLFIFTVECLPDLIRMLPAETRKKYFPTIKTT